MNLYQIEQEMLKCVDEETGDVVDFDRLNSLEMERDVKISNIAGWIKDLDAEEKAIGEEINKLQARKKADGNKKESLKKYLSDFLNGAKYTDARCAINYSKSTSTEFTGDIDDLPEDCVKITREASLTAIKKHLLAGDEIEGAKLVERQNIQIR
jgi:hypothetical protein